MVQTRKAHRRRNNRIAKDHLHLPKGGKVLCCLLPKCPQEGWPSLNCKRDHFCFLCLPILCDSNFWLSSVINSLWSPCEFSFPTGLLLRWSSTLLTFPCYRMISPFSSLYQKFYVDWKNFRWLRQWLPHSSYVENTPGNRHEGIGESDMERKERQCGVGPELVPASHLTTLTDNRSSAHLATVMAWGPSFNMIASPSGLQVFKRREKFSLLCPSYVLKLMTSSKQSASIC